MTILTNENELVKIREAGKILKDVFSLIEKKIKPGVSTLDLDIAAEEMIGDTGAEPAFKGYRGYPATICASRNEVVVHGIPRENIVLIEGDILSVDIGVRKNGYFTDAARTYAVGVVSSEARRLIDGAKFCLDEGIKKAVSGARVSDISNAIQLAAKERKLKEVRMFVGHGVGRKLHEAPEIPNWGEKGKGSVLREGLVLAIEPMVNIGTRKVKIMSDGWTAVTTDGKLSAHFEDTIVVKPKKAEIIT